LEGSGFCFDGWDDDGRGGSAGRAIANTKRGNLVGDRTFGLASEQKLIPLDDGAALILTVGNFSNADGKSILDEGVTPTEVVRAAAATETDDGEDVAATGVQKEPAPGPRRFRPTIRFCRRRCNC